jgi:hypothetical protein
LVSDGAITLCCDVCGRAVRASEARVTHSRDEVQYACPRDNEVLAVVSVNDLYIAASAVTFRVGHEELDWSEFFDYESD